MARLILHADTWPSAHALRCAQVVCQLANAHYWNLEQPDLVRYVAALSGLLPPDCDEQRLVRVAGYYHTDHHLVEALCDTTQPDYHTAWQQWVGLATRELHSRRLAVLYDGAIECADLVQEALADLARELPRYRYESHFRFWAYQVITRSALSQRERLLAKKRYSVRISYDPASHADSVIDPQPIEATVAARLFACYAATVLHESSPDTRLAQILFLYAGENRTFRDIGVQIGLSHARVKALFDQAVTILRTHDGVRRWYADYRFPDSFRFEEQPV